MIRHISLMKKLVRKKDARKKESKVKKVLNLGKFTSVINKMKVLKTSLAFRLYDK